MSSEELQARAIITAINAALLAGPLPQSGVVPADRRAYDLDEIPEPRPQSGYVAVEVFRRYIEGFRLGGAHGSRGGRLVTRYASRSVTTTRLLQARTRLALENVGLTATDGSRVGPFRFEATLTYQPDEGWHEAGDQWTYANLA